RVELDVLAADRLEALELGDDVVATRQQVGKRIEPAAVVTVVIDCWVCRLRAGTVTPGITAPCSSLIGPDSVPRSNCPTAGAAHASTRSTAAHHALIANLLVEQQSGGGHQFPRRAAKTSSDARMILLSCDVA